MFPARLTEESIWLLGDEAVDTLLPERPRPVPHSTAFPDAGIYILAESQPSSPQIMVDAGPQGTQRCGHGHADALSMRLTMDGQRWLVDAGSGVYISADASERDAFRGTGAHNTMRVDGLDQAQPDGPFAWSAIPTTRLDNWIAGKTFSYFVACHDGYTRLADPVTHCRRIVKINGGPMLVCDLALGQKEHDLEVLWHFSPELEVRQTCEQTFLSSRCNGEGPALCMIVPAGTPWQTAISRVSISPAYGQFQMAPQLSLHARMRLPAETATLLTPRHGSVASDGNMVGTREATVQIYEWAENDTHHTFCFALDKRPWNFGPWFADAEFLYFRTSAHKLVHLIVVGGTYVAWKGQELLKAPGPSVFFEWHKQSELLHSEPEVFTTSPLFQKLTGGAPLLAEAVNISSTYAEKP